MYVFFPVIYVENKKEMCQNIYVYLCLVGLCLFLCKLFCIKTLFSMGMEYFILDI